MNLVIKVSTYISVIAMLAMPVAVLAAPYYNPPYRNDIGLNSHWALGGFGRDELYRSRLQDSNTKWVREHFEVAVFNVERPEAWFERYDFVINEYKKQNIQVVGMLAYGVDDGDRFVADKLDWAEKVGVIVDRYKDDVDVWEVWNEPDSPDYLVQNSPQEYISMLKPAYSRIKAIDPSAQVVSAGLASPNLDFAKVLLEQASGYFDIFGVHYYYGERYLADGRNLAQLERGARDLRELVNMYNPSMQIWVTEYGLSTGSRGVTDELQREYMQAASEMLIQKGYAQKLFIYNIRNYDYNTHYENNFGFLDLVMRPRPAWDWYARIPRGPYDKVRTSLSYEQQMAIQLKGELEIFFGEGLIPISAQNWPTVVQAYVYGGYDAKDIAQAIRFGGKTVHPKFQKKFWKSNADYLNYTNKDWTGGLIVYAYDKPRINVTDEAARARELREALQLQYDYPKLGITSGAWGELVKAYVYGGYPVDAIAKSIRSGWRTVNLDASYEEWKTSPDYIKGINTSL